MPNGLGHTHGMAIDFTLTPELEAIRAKTRDFIDTVVKPLEAGLREDDRKHLIHAVV